MTETVTMVPIADHFMQRLAGKVVDLLPVAPDETFDDYAARARREPSAGRRALIAAQVSFVSDSFKAERQERKRAWIAAARCDLFAGEREGCAVCKKYYSLTEAHHVYPLSRQFDDGLVRANHEFAWLCPTHHAAVHAGIAAFERFSYPGIPGMPKDEQAAVEKLILRYIELRSPAA